MARHQLPRADHGDRSAAPRTDQIDLRKLPSAGPQARTASGTVEHAERAAPRGRTLRPRAWRYRHNAHPGLACPAAPEGRAGKGREGARRRSEEHTAEIQSLMRT